MKEPASGDVSISTEQEAAPPPKERAPAPRPAPTASPSFPAFVEAWCTHQGLSVPALHDRIAEWLGKKWESAGAKRLLLLAFRGAGKSTLVGLLAAWLLAREPALRILTLSADLALARKMVRNVKRVIESHPQAAGLKPDRPELWSAEQFTVARAPTLRDPSMLARGIDGNITGSRADVVICDDVEVPGNSDSPVKRAALREKLAEIDFILVPQGAQLYLGTPHSYYSIYADTPRAEAGEERAFLDGFEREVFAIRDAAGDSVWPERFSAEAIERLERKAGPLKFASQMLLTPTAPAECRLDATKLRRYGGAIKYREAQGRGSLWLEGRKLASMRVWWDPAYGRTARASRNVIAVVYQDEQGGYWLDRVEYLALDPPPPVKKRGGDGEDKIEAEAEADQLCRKAAALVQLVEAPAITVEDNGVGKFVPGLLRKALAALGSPATVVEHHARVPKDERILSAFDVTLAAGLLHARDTVCDGPFLQELREWLPGGKSGRHDDAVDAVAGAILAEPTRLGPYPRPPGALGAWRSAGHPHKAATDFEP